MRDARFTIPTPSLLAKAVDGLDGVPMVDRDTKGDVYEYMLSKIATAGQHGQFRTPRHIIQLIVEMMQPGPKDVICDPGSLGIFIRRLVGLDRVAAKDALAGFLDQRPYSADQIEFVNLVIDELAAIGVIEPRRFYEAPFTDLSPQGPHALFETGDVDRLLDVVADVRKRASAA